MDAMYDINKCYFQGVHYKFGEIFGYMDKSLNWSINKIIVLSVIYSNNFTSDNK